MKKWVPFILFLSIPLWVFGLTACRERVVQSPGSRKLQVVATTTIVGDVVYQISAGLVDFDVLLPVGSDPHGFYPTPQDVAMIADADIVFANGAGLEAFLEDLIDSAGAKEKLVSVSEGVDFLTYGGEGVQDHGNGSSHDELEEEEPEYQDETEEGHLSGGVDPHTWTDPNNVMIWIQNITHVLIEHDPEHRITYETNAVKYQAELLALDAWIREEVAQIPEVDRRLVTDHTIFSYFVDEYGFEQVGALILRGILRDPAGSLDIASYPSPLPRNWLR